MSRNKRKKPKQVKFNGTQITSVFVDEAESLVPGLWADPEPKHTKPVEEPEKPFEYAKGGIALKNPTGLFGDSRSGFNMDGLHPTGKYLSGVKGSLNNLGDSFQRIGRALRNVGPITVMVDSEAPISQETIDRILGPQKKQEPLEPTTLAKTINPKLNNLCAEVELPARKLTVEEHRQFIRDMMSADAARVKSLYYQEPVLKGPVNTTAYGTEIPKVVVEVGRKPLIQQFVDITKETSQ